MVSISVEERAVHSLANNTDSIAFASMLDEIAQKLRDVSKATDASSKTVTISGSIRTEDLVMLAEEELRRRRLRYRHLPQHLFGEAAWTMLLDLFVSQHRGRNIATTSACLASDVPPTTALRWLEVLERFELVNRWATKTDKRVRYVSLTNRGDAAVRAILEGYTA